MEANRKTTVIRFFAPVIEPSINQLSATIDQKLREGVERLVLLISSPGGSVFHGLSAYNLLKGIPAEVITHNFGSVDSIGVVMYCAGSKRLSVPHARFLIHPVGSRFEKGQHLEEKQLEERLKGLQIDEQNIAGVIAANTGKREDEVIEAMRERTTLNPEQAEEWGLVHEIKSELFETGSDLVLIQPPSSQARPQAAPS